MVKIISGDRDLYLNKEERRKFSDGLVYFMERCYLLESINKKEKEAFVNLQEFQENQFYEALKTSDEGLSDIEKLVFKHSWFKPFPLIFEEINNVTSLRKHELLNILNSLEKKNYLSKFSLPSSLNLLLPCIEIDAKTENTNMYIKLFPGKIIYSIEENQVFFDCILNFLKNFHKIKQNLEIEELFGPVKEIDIAFYQHLKKIYDNILTKYKTIEAIEESLKEVKPESSISLYDLAKLQEAVYRGEASFEQFEEKFTKLLEAVERGEFVYAEIKSDAFSELKKLSNAANILAQKNLALYNDLIEAYNKAIKYQTKEQQINVLIDFFVKKKKVLDEYNLDLLKKSMKEIIDMIKK